MKNIFLTVFILFFVTGCVVTPYGGYGNYGTYGAYGYVTPPVYYGTSFYNPMFFGFEAYPNYFGVFNHHHH